MSLLGVSSEPIFYEGDRVLISSWSPNFDHMRGRVISAGQPKGRVSVHLDGDTRPTLFFLGEVHHDLSSHA